MIVSNEEILAAAQTVEPVGMLRGIRCDEDLLATFSDAFGLVEIRDCNVGFVVMPTEVFDAFTTRHPGVLEMVPPSGYIGVPDPYRRATLWGAWVLVADDLGHAAVLDENARVVSHVRESI